MKVDYSKDFEKAVRKLSGKILKSVIDAIDNVKLAQSIDDISNCRKIESLNSVYRIRIGDKRTFFVYIEIEDNLVKFEYLLNRGEAYNKKNMQKLKNKDC